MIKSSLGVCAGAVDIYLFMDSPIEALDDWAQ